MKGIKRCIPHLILLFVFSFTSFLTYFSGNANALVTNNYTFMQGPTGMKTECGAFPLPSNYRAQMTTSNPLITWDEDHSWIMTGAFGSSATPTYKEIYYSTEPITAYNVNQTNKYVFKTTVDSTTARSWLSQYNTGSTMSTVNLSGQGNVANCWWDSHNITYDSSWDTTDWFKVPSKTASGGDTIECDTFDITCKIKQVFFGITDTFIAVGEAIVSGISYLFTPDGTTFEYSFNELQEFFLEKFGFLTYPIEFALDLFDATVGEITNNANWGTTQCGGSQELGTGSAFMGGNVSLNLCAMPSSVMTPLRIVVQIAFSMMLLYMFRHKVHEVMTQ